MGSPKTPKVPKPPPLPPPPEQQVERAINDPMVRARDERRRLALAAAGRAGTIVTSGQGVTGAPALATRTLLGSA